MKGKILIRVSAMAMFLLIACGSHDSYAQRSKGFDLFEQKNLVAWCIVPFDSKNRTPVERIAMLKRLHFSQYAYDWRHQHLDSFAEEIKLARENNIRISAVWLWIDKNTDAPGKLSEDNERLLQLLKDNGLNTQLWVGFNNNYFEYDTEQAKVSAGVEIVKYLRERTKSVATSIGLYNHGDWFGEPDNEIKIVRELNDPGVGIVYNFHHGHAQIDAYPGLLSRMGPWLWCVNIDGMKRTGPQILPVGSGDEELGMLKLLKQSGYKGPIGILGHIETEDVEVVLKRNLEGLAALSKKL